MRASWSIVVVAAAVLLGGCSGSRITGQRVGFTPGHGTGQAATLGVNSDDNARTATILVKLMTQHPEVGFRVLAVASDGIGVARGRFKFVLQPQIRGPGKINKVLVRQLYAVKDELAGQADHLAELCFEVNSTMPFLRVSIQQTPQGPLFVAESELAFGDTLDLEQLGTYLDELKRATLTMGAARMVAYLK